MKKLTVVLDYYEAMKTYSRIGIVSDLSNDIAPLPSPMFSNDKVFAQNPLSTPLLERQIPNTTERGTVEINEHFLDVLRR
jgi:hypothetical protein